LGKNELMSKVSKILIGTFFSAFLLGLTTQNISFAATKTISTKVGATKAVIILQTQIIKLETDLNAISQQTANAQAMADLELAAQVKQFQSQHDSAAALADQEIARLKSALIPFSEVTMLVGNISGGWCPNAGNCILGSKFSVSPDFDISKPIELQWVTATTRTQYISGRAELNNAISDRSKLEDELNQNIVTAQLARKNSIPTINQTYLNRASLGQEKISVLKPILDAAKRAAKAPSGFDAAFKNAYTFQHNLDCIYQLANSSFSDMQSLLSVRTVLSSIKENDAGQLIALSYSDSKAKAWNKKWGSTFNQFDNFDQSLNYALQIYRSFA